MVCEYQLSREEYNRTLLIDSHKELPERTARFSEVEMNYFIARRDAVTSPATRLHANSVGDTISLHTVSRLRLVRAFSFPRKFLLQVIRPVESQECGCPDSTHVLTTEKISMKEDAASFAFLDMKAMASTLGSTSRAALTCSSGK